MHRDANDLIIGVDIGGSKIQIGFFHDGKLEVFFHQSTPQDPQNAVEMIEDGIRNACLPAPLRAIGIGCPGPLDQNEGVVLSPPYLPEWRNFPIVSLLEDRFAVPVLLENDGNAGALGEAVHGAARDCRYVFYITISTGIGTGIVIDKEVYRGAYGLAGEIWAFDPATFHGKTSTSNINDLASGKHMVRRAKELLAQGENTSVPEDDMTPENLTAAFEKGDPLATKVFRSAHEILAASVCFVETLLAPDIVVLGGGLCTNPQWMVDPIRTLVQQWQPIDALKKIPIRRAELWDEAVLYGAISLFRAVHD